MATPPTDTDITGNGSESGDRADGMLLAGLLTGLGVFCLATLLFI